jgi:hypothetical protein
MKKGSNEYLNFVATYNETYSTVNISGNILNPESFNTMLLLGANPPDKIGNYSGSSLPFPSFDIAFDNTVNKYVIPKDGAFNITFKYPNSYYKHDGRTKVISPILFMLDKLNFTFELSEKCILKTLVPRKTSNPIFYALKDEILPIDTAEKIMYAYSNAKIEHNLA